MSTTARLIWVCTALSIFSICNGCAVHRARLQQWRLIQRDAGDLLVPPDVASADTPQRTLKLGGVGAGRQCAGEAEAVALRVRRKNLFVTVIADGLARQPNGWLGSWAAQLEEQGCIEVGYGAKFAERVSQAIPIDSAAPLRLLYRDERQTGEVDLVPPVRLRVVSPFWRQAGVGMIDGPITVTGNDRNLNLQVTAKSTENLLGYERSVYAIYPKAGHRGYEITPLDAQRQVGDKTEFNVHPAVNYFQFPAEAGYYRLFFESWRNDFAALVVGARTAVELERRTRALEAHAATASCRVFQDEMCITLPKQVAVVPLISVTVNGAEVLLARGAKLSQAIRISGVAEPKTVLGKLSVSKLWSNRLTQVAFDRSDTAILNLTLMGGEVISWR